MSPRNNLKPGLFIVTLGLTVALAAALAANGALAGDPQEGERLARQWCASCHLVAEDQAEAGDAAPPFMAIANQRDSGDIIGWLNDPHPPMPDPNLTKREIDDLTSYIKSLAE